MTKDEQYLEIGRAHVELENLRRKQMCIRNKFSTLSRQISSAISAIDGHGDFPENPGIELDDAKSTKERIDELEKFLKSVSGRS